MSVTPVPHSVHLEERADGSLILTSALDHLPPVRTVGDWLDSWAAEAPDRVFIAERSGDGWHEVGYAEMLARVRAVAAALLARGLGPERPLVVLSGPSVDHATIALAAQYVGVPVVPLAEQYSLIAQAHDRLRDILGRVRPGLVFTLDAGAFAGALALPDLADVEVVASRTEGAPRPVTPFADLLAASDAGGVEAAHAGVGPDTLAKILFTSGSTSAPKGVLTTHGMMCVNQAQYATVLPHLAARPPKMLDWLPWNHVFAGNSNFNMILANGGSLYLDGGKPVKGLFDTSLANLRAHAGNLAFNVPLYFAMLVREMERDAGLRRAFFADLDILFYAGASLDAATWTALERMGREERGEAPMMISSWGMTETAPSALIVHEPAGRTGVIGVPMPRTEVKLIPDEFMRCELRVRGPQVMPGYHEDPKRNAESFDDEGFFITGDAVRFAEPGNPRAGLVFDGRVSEDFKLTSGTWVHASNLRLDALKEFGRIAQDVVVCGAGQAEVGLLVFPNPAALEAAGIAAERDGGALAGEPLMAEVRGHLARLAEHATGSSTRVARALVLADPPSVKDHEITAKGSLNVNRVWTCRAGELARLYAPDDPAVVRL